MRRSWRNASRAGSRREAKGGRYTPAATASRARSGAPTGALEHGGHLVELLALRVRERRQALVGVAGVDIGPALEQPAHRVGVAGARYRDQLRLPCR